MLLSASMWREILPRRFYTQKFMCRSFRTLSHSKCVVAAKILKEIRRAPISSFLILDNDAEAEKLAKTPLCLVDEVFVQSLMHYGRSAQALRSREVQHIVRLHAQLAKVNISWLESLHAALRRRLTARSCQTRGVDFMDASAEFVIDRFRLQPIVRLMRQDCEARVAKGAGEEDSEVEERSDRRCAGPWRLYCSERRRGEENNTRRINSASWSRDYHALPEAEKASLNERGREAQLSVLAGSRTSFGLPPSQIEDAKIADRAAAIVAHSGYAPVVRPTPTEVVVQNAVAKVYAKVHTQPYQELYLAATREVALQAKVESAIVKAERREVQSWIEANTASTLTHMRSSVPNVGGLLQHFLALPNVDQTCLKLEINTDSISKLMRMMTQQTPNQFGKLLQMDWETKHVTIRHANAADINEKKAPQRTTEMCRCRRVPLQ